MGRQFLQKRELWVWIFGVLVPGASLGSRERQMEFREIPMIGFHVKTNPLGGTGVTMEAGNGQSAAVFCRWPG